MFRDLFKSKKKIKEEIFEELRAAEEQRWLVEEKAAEEAKREEDRKRSEEPWVDIKGLVEDAEKGIRVDLDWNDAFIDYLRKNGITGADDETVIQKWITMLYKDLIDQNQADQTVGINNDLI